MADPRLKDLTLVSVEVTKRTLGSGSYGEVVEVRLDRLRCAGKKLHDIFFSKTFSGQQQAIMDRFVEECLRLSKLRHPNVVQLIGVHYMKESQRPVMVMELLPMSLAQCLERHEQIPGFLKTSILCDVSLGLLYLHSRTPPIIHRDLTANNILLTSSMSAKLADLGVARIVNLNPAQLTTRMTIAPGAPAYMPPEALSDSPHYDEKLDVFSFGNLILHVYSHQWPIPLTVFTADPRDPSKTIARTEVQRRQSYLDAMDEGPLKSLAVKCLQNLPDQRPTSRAIVKQLEDLCKSSAVLLSNVLDLTVENVTLKEQLKERDTIISKLRKKLEDVYAIVTGDPPSIVVQQDQPGLQWAVQGMETSFEMVATQDCLSVNIPPPVSSFSCNLVSCRGGNSRFTSCGVSSVAAGKYKVTYTPINSGLHRVQVLLQGRDVPGSPFVVQVFPSGQSVRSINKLKGPRGITITKKADVIFAERYGHCVKIRMQDGVTHTIGSQGTMQGMFFEPHGIAVTADDRILVTDCHNHRIQQFTMSGECANVVGGKGKAPLQFMHPRGLDIHPSGKIFVAECTGNCIQVLNRDLSYSHRLGSKGKAGHFQYPFDVACDTQGAIYVADSWNHCVHKLTEDGISVVKFGSEGSGEGQLNEPSAIAIDSRGFVYVTEKQNHRLSIFSSSSEFLHSFGSKGKAPGQFLHPCGVAVDGDGLLYICNTDNDRIDIF